MTDLSGLGVELRRAAQCMQTHYPADKKAHSGDCVYWLLYETAAVLVEKEMLKLKEDLKKEIAACSEYDHDLKTDVVQTKTALKNVEEAFG